MTLFLLFLLSLLLCLLLVPIVKRLAPALGLMDEPRALGVHSRPMPRAGGLAFFLAFLAALGLAPERPAPVFFLGMGLSLLLGLAEDRFRLSQGLRLGLQAVIAGIAAAWLPFANGLPLLAYPVLVLWTVGMMNAVNLLDGLDGLAAGSSAISLLAFLALALWTGQGGVAIMAAALTGALLGFLRYNFHPASIFMGDAGSLFLGFVLSQLPFMLSKEEGGLSLLAGAAIVLGLPVFESGLTLLRRSLARRPLLLGDRGHFYDQLMVKASLSHRRAVLLSYSLALGFALSGLVLVRLALPWGVLPLLALAGVLLWSSQRLGSFRS